MKITKTSILTGKTRTRDIEVTQEQIDVWKAGKTIQEAMPGVSVEDREFLMTGATAEEWKEHFPPEDYDDDV